MKLYIKRYEKNNWAIVKEAITPELSEKTGKPNKNAGQPHYLYRYPGSLVNTAGSLLDEALGEVEIGSDAENFRQYADEILEKIKQVLAEAERNVLEGVRLWVEE
jgi:hypothetical protein